MKFLSLDEIVEIHHDQISRYGGLSGIRDTRLLNSAVSMPSTTFDGRFLHRDRFEMAAAYMYHLIGNHPFLDGDIRTGLVAGLVFLEINGIQIDARQGELKGLIQAVTEGVAGKPEIAAFLRAHAV